MFGLLSAGCLFWLEKLQPVFFVLALGSLAYQIAIYVRRPKTLRTWGIKAILFTSVLINLAVIGAWIALWLRYR
ncbi:MAG: hypothetical protein EXQ56_06850 [Acidobacteria bacterium]|nr:hypothetical protein [Acidobacteriota bacterium]